MAAERRVEIVDAYIALVAETSTAEIPAAAIAERAGVARTAIAHFVGDRTALRIAATEEIGRRYESTIRSAWTDETPEALIAVLFSNEWTSDRSDDDRAFDVLVASAERDRQTAAAIRRVYDVLVGELADAIVAERGVDPSAAADVAYSIVCIAEMNVAMLALGVSPARSVGAATAARRLLDSV